MQRSEALTVDVNCTDHTDSGSTSGLNVADAMPSRSKSTTLEVEENVTLTLSSSLNVTNTDPDSVTFLENDKKETTGNSGTERNVMYFVHISSICDK